MSFTKNFMLVLISCSFIACENLEQDNVVTQIAQALTQEVRNQDVSVTNNASIFVGQILSNENRMISGGNVIPDETMILEMPPVVAESPAVRVVTQVVHIQNDSMPVQKTQAEAKPTDNSLYKRQYLHVLQQGVHIRVGVDRLGEVVRRSHATKITTIVMPYEQASSVDVYLYAIPTYSHLVRNHNTLIGFVKSVDLINGQAQFTRYWNGKRANNQWLKLGKYNIYVEYHYKDAQGQVLKKDGRFWGGSHRNWFISLKK